MPAVQVLNTVIAETGPTQVMKDVYLKKDKPMRFSCSLGSGDTVVIEGALTSSGTMRTLHTFTQSSHVDVYLPRYWRCRRTVDGTSADSTVTAQNERSLRLTAHT